MNVARSLCLLCIVAVVGCKHANPLYCDPDTPCTDPSRPFCDLTGDLPGSDGAGNTCVPMPDFDAGPDAGLACEPNRFLECEDVDTEVRCNSDGSASVATDCQADLACSEDHGGCACEPSTSVCADGRTIHCNASGQIERVEDCPLSCHPSGARCNDVMPSNGLAQLLDMAADGPVVALPSDASIGNGGTIKDTDGNVLPAVPSFTISAPPGGVDIRVLVVRSIELTNFSNSSGSALAIVSDGDIVVRGVIRVWSGFMPGCAGGTAILVNPNIFGGIYTGAGGGGFALAGGLGGDASGESGGSRGLANLGATLVPLRGGCAGGADGTFNAAGGGALQLVSRTRIVLEPGVASVGRINAGGRGGGDGLMHTDNVPRGGGAGGGILLEAPEVIIGTSSVLAANGGSGRSGCHASGSDGLLSADPAPGGQCPGANDGGQGGSLNGNAGDGGDFAGDTNGGGGGGGGVGKIRINTRLNGFQAAAGAVISPAPSLGGIGIR